MAEQVTPKEVVMAVIKDPGIGMRDVDEPVLWFDTYTSEGIGALQVLDWDRAYRVMRGVRRSISELEGRACWVETDGTTMKFIRLFGDEEQ